MQLFSRPLCQTVNLRATTVEDGRTQATQLRDTRLFGLVFAALAVLALLPLLIVKYPPMVDLPQHAAQIRLWQDLDQHSDTYKLNLLTPYLATYLAGRLLAEVLPILTAMKVLVALLVLALPSALLHLLVRTGGDRWWSLLGFPLSYSLCFYWGLLNFMAAAPLAIVLVTLALNPDRGLRQRRGHELVLAALALVLLFTHGLVCAFALLVAGLASLTTAPSWRAAILRQLPFLPAALAGLWWFAATRSAETQTSMPFRLGFRWDRLYELPGALLGDPEGFEAKLCGTAILALILSVLIRRKTSSPVPEAAPIRLRVAHALPLGLALAVFFFGPNIYFLAAFLNLRFAIFLVPWLLLAVMPGRSADKTTRAMIAVLAAGWLINLLPGFTMFDREARMLDVPLAAMEPDRRALGLVFEPHTTAVPVPAHLHLFAWYSAQKGGVADFSFAFFYSQLVRYRPEAVEPLIPDSFSWRPERFDDSMRSSYDYFLVRSRFDRGALLFPEPSPPIRARLWHGGWWLYERVESSLEN